jgi:hypothetical protein
MKKVLVFAIAALIANFSFGQKMDESAVPANVKSKMTTSFPNAKSVKWSKEDNNYEAEFMLNKQETSCVISATAELLETETEMSVSDLPANIKTIIQTDYPGSKINEAAKIESKGVITYEAEVKIGEDSYDMIYDNSGKFISKTKLSEEDKD